MGNPLLEEMQKLLAAHAPELLENYWTARGMDGTPALQVPARMQNVLNLGSLQMMYDLASSSGLVLTTIRSGVGGNERVQIVLRLQADSVLPGETEPRGFTYLDTVSQMNSVRYAFRLDTENQAWQKSRGSGLGDAMPGNTGTSGGFQFTGGESSGPGAHSGVARDFVLAPTLAQSTRNKATGGYRQLTEEERNTMFSAGRADFYGGILGGSLTLTRTWVPSRLLNTVGLNMPHHVAKWSQDDAGGRRDTVTRNFYLAARILVPEPLIHHETVPELPPGNIAAIEEKLPGEPVSSRPLKITRDEIIKRQIVVLGAYGELLQAWHPWLRDRLRGVVTPRGGDRSYAVARMIEPGTRGDDALYNMLSGPMLTSHLENMLAKPLGMPKVVREGGPLTDTHGEATVEIELHDPKILGYFSAWDEGTSNVFAEMQRNRSSTSGLSLLNLAMGGQLNTGDLSVEDPVSPARRTLTGMLDPAFGRTRTKSAGGTLQAMPHLEAMNRSLPWMRAAVDATVTVTYTAQNRRDWIKAGSPGTWLGGGKVAVRTQLRNLFEMAFSPEASIRHDLYHPGGIQIPFGTFYPDPRASRSADTDDLLRAAFSLPFLDNMFGVLITMEDGKFVVGHDRLDATKLAAEISTRLSQLPPEPSPDLDPDERAGHRDRGDSAARTTSSCCSRPTPPSCRPEAPTRLPSSWPTRRRPILSPTATQLVTGTAGHSRWISRPSVIPPSGAAGRRATMS